MAGKLYKSIFSICLALVLCLGVVSVSQAQPLTQNRFSSSYKSTYASSNIVRNQQNNLYPSRFTNRSYNSSYKTFFNFPCIFGLFCDDKPEETKEYNENGDLIKDDWVWPGRLVLYGGIMGVKVDTSDWGYEIPDNLAVYKPLYENLCGESEGWVEQIGLGNNKIANFNGDRYYAMCMSQINEGLFLHELAHFYQVDVYDKVLFGPKHSTDHWGKVSDGEVQATCVADLTANKYIAYLNYGEPGDYKRYGIYDDPGLCDLPSVDGPVRDLVTKVCKNSIKPGCERAVKVVEDPESKLSEHLIFQPSIRNSLDQNVVSTFLLPNPSICCYK